MALRDPTGSTNRLKTDSRVGQDLILQPGPGGAQSTALFTRERGQHPETMGRGMASRHWKENFSPFISTRVEQERLTGLEKYVVRLQKN